MDWVKSLMVSTRTENKDDIDASLLKHEVVPAAYVDSKRMYFVIYYFILSFVSLIFFLPLFKTRTELMCIPTPILLSHDP